MPVSKNNNSQVFAAPCKFDALCTFEKIFVPKGIYTFAEPIDAAAIMLNTADAAHTLPFYDEGTFIPEYNDASFSQAEGQTYNTQLGNFTVIGDWVFFDLRIDMLSVGTLTGSDAINITMVGAPAMKADGFGTCLMGDVKNVNASGVIQLTGKFDPATQSIRLMEQGVTAGHNSIIVTRMQTGDFTISGWYEKA